jgi:UDP:flavonoid glycosyltransferase YjiC (YdhE family)
MAVLLAAHPTVGHTQALRAIGAELRKRGHAVHFATSHVPKLPSFIAVPQPMRAAQEVLRSLEVDGFPLIRTPFSLRAMFAAGRVAATRGYDELRWATELFTADTLRATRVLARELERRRIELVVHDFAFLAAWLAAELADVPSAAVFHSGLPFPVPGHPPFGSGLPIDSPPDACAAAQRRLDSIMARMDRRLGSARRALGLPPVAPTLFTIPYSHGLNVLTSFEVFELPRPDLAQRAAGPLLWAGLCLGERAEEPEALSWRYERSARPSVYVSLGTVFNDQPSVYRALLEGVHRVGARAIVAAGASHDRIAPLATPDDVVVRYAPQLTVLNQVDAVIGHGGNNSTNETLRAGKPLLIVPFGAEQITNARRVEALGVGCMLRPEELSAARIARLVGQILSDSMRVRARQLSESVPAEDGTANVATALEGLIRR